MAVVDDEEAEGAERRRGIQSVEIGLKVLSALAEAGGQISLSALVQRTGLSPSQTHRYLQSLTASGFAAQDGPSGRYDLGPASRRLGVAALSRFDSFARADEVMPELVAKIRWTVLLSVMGPGGPTVVRWYMGRPSVITNLGVGSVLPIYHSATGRAFIAFSEPAEIDDLLRSETLALQGIDGIDAEKIRRDARMKMCVFMEGKFIPGLRAVSAPVFDMQGRLSFCATAIANAAFPDAADESIGEALRDACRLITEDSGGRWPG